VAGKLGSGYMFSFEWIVRKLKGRMMCTNDVGIDRRHVMRYRGAFRAVRR
jgi:hypothetical protein